MFVLTPEHFNSSFALAAIYALVIEIDSLDGSTFAGEVDDLSAGSFRESMPQRGLEGLIVAKCHDHIKDFDRCIFDPNLNLSKPALASAHVDLVAIIFEIHLTLTEKLPTSRRLSGAALSGIQAAREILQDVKAGALG